MVEITTAEGSWMNVVDLDPYGTTALFIDTAMGSVHDLGLLCETCDTTNYLTYGMADLHSTAHARRLLDLPHYGGQAVRQGYTVCA